MLRHVVVFTWKDGVSADDVVRAGNGLAALPAQIPQIRSYAFGPDARLVAGNADFALVADFDDADAYRAYATHPAHQEVLVTLMRPLTASRAAVQYEV